MSEAGEIQIERVRSFASEHMRLLEQYYEALGVVLRDGPEGMHNVIDDPRSGMWVARQGSALAGCVVLKAGVPERDTGECKRLYVRDAYRRRGLADALMEAAEEFARTEGLRWVYLDTHESFAASVALYRRRGYEACARYNLNPQATMFFRKRLARSLG